MKIFLATKTFLEKTNSRKFLIKGAERIGKKKEQNYEPAEKKIET